MKVKSGLASRPAAGQVSDMDLRLLRVFKTVADCGGMVAAELELNIGLSTVSRHVKDLETRLGLVLCRRGRAGFALTAEGQRVYDQTMALLTSVDAFRESIDDIHRRLGGQLEIALFDKTASNPASHIGEAIGAFNDQAPDVELHVHIANISAIERGVMDGTFHAGVIPAHRASQAFAYTDLFGERMQLYCGRRHPLFAEKIRMTWARLKQHRLAGLGFHSPNMQLAHQARLSRAATGYDQEAIATLILSGKFLGFLPDHYASPFETRGEMRVIEPATLKYDCRFVALARRSPKPSRAAALFVACLARAHEVRS